MTFLDLFSGIGGFRLGMEQAGHECVGHIEIDKYANKSYEAMHNPKESEFHATDIRLVQPGNLPEADVYCGGVPCQSWSIAGKRGGFQDERGSMWYQYCRLLKAKQPKFFIAENVKGLLSHNEGKSMETICEMLCDCGYALDFDVLNSKNFGVPQNRERVFIVGVRLDLLDTCQIF